MPDHPHCHSAALVVFSPLDVTSTVMTRMHVRSSIRAHSPLPGSSVNESCEQDTEQIHDRHLQMRSVTVGQDTDKRTASHVV